MKTILTPDDIALVMEVAASSADARAAYAAVDELAQRAIGYRLFTVMRYLPETVEVERLYSSNPSAYPPAAVSRSRAHPGETPCWIAAKLSTRRLAAGTKSAKRAFSCESRRRRTTTAISPIRTSYQWSS